MPRILIARDAHGAIESTKGETMSNIDSPQSEDPTFSSRDAADMRKMGVKQQTKRRFGFVTILAFTTTMMSTWESALPFFLTAYVNGGGPTMLYGFIVAFVGALATCASMAEMASM